MTALPQHAPVWFDLSVRDIEGAKAFYGELFGWRFEDSGEEFGHYLVAYADDVAVAGLMSCDASAEDAIPAWMPYLGTSDIKASLKAVTAGGGNVVSPETTLPDTGIMAIVTDPTGSAFGLWQAAPFVGTTLAALPGRAVWCECATDSFDEALRFFRDALGWEIEWMGEDGRPAEESTSGWRYVTNGSGDDAICGLFDAVDYLPDTPSFWQVYFCVPDEQTAIEVIGRHGGEIIEGPEDTPWGRIATARDPQGAVFLFMCLNHD